MSRSASLLIKVAATQGLVPVDVARRLIEQVRQSRDAPRLAEDLLVQGGWCTAEVISRLRAEVAVMLASQPEQPPSPPGYRLIDRLGGGGMGEVYRAEQLSMHRIVALKLLGRELVRDAQLGERFLREARAAGAVHHPHVIGCYDVGSVDGRYFMALEYAGGGDAERLMDSVDHRLEARRALEIIRDCAEGLEALHDAGFIHRDLKPSNILLSDVGQAKVGDLGLVSGPTSDQRLTHIGFAMGTPAYMSPEQADGDLMVDLRSDIYSLGASLFYLLTGHPPYTGASAWAIVAKVIHEPFPDPRRLNPTVSEACAAVLQRATAKRREERYQSAHEFRHALEVLLADPSADLAQRPPASDDADAAPHAGPAHLPPPPRPAHESLHQALPPPLPSGPTRPPARRSAVTALLAVAVLLSGAAIMIALGTTSAAQAHTTAAAEPAGTPWLGQSGVLGADAAASAAFGPPVDARAAPPVATHAPAVLPRALPVVAVLGCEAGDETLRAFAQAFPELLTVALSATGSYDLVERTQLHQVLSEQELTEVGIIDSGTAARLGHLVGARVLITERVTTTDATAYLTVKAIDVESGRVKAVSKAILRADVTPAVMAAVVARDLGPAIDALSVRTSSAAEDSAALVARLQEAVHGHVLPTVVVVVQESVSPQGGASTVVRTELQDLLRQSGFRVIESDDPALAEWARACSAGRTTPFPHLLSAVQVVIAGSGAAESSGSVGPLSTARAHLSLSALTIDRGQVLAAEHATVSAADASERLAGTAALAMAVRHLAVRFVTDLTAAWSHR
jgi:serine/threonine protein kinase